MACMVYLSFFKHSIRILFLAKRFTIRQVHVHNSSLNFKNGILIPTSKPFDCRSSSSFGAKWHCNFGTWMKSKNLGPKKKNISNQNKWILRICQFDKPQTHINSRWSEVFLAFSLAYWRRRAGRRTRRYTENCGTLSFWFYAFALDEFALRPIHHHLIRSSWKLKYPCSLFKTQRPIKSKILPDFKEKIIIVIRFL